jgi:hypothetical protein
MKSKASPQPGERHSRGEHQTAVGRSREVLGDALTEKTTVGNGPTVVDGDKLDGTRRAMAKHIAGCGMTLPHRSHGSLGHWGAHPCEVGCVIVDQDDEPLVFGEVTGAAQGRPVASVEDIFDEEFEVEPAKREHQKHLLLLTCCLAEPAYSNFRHATLIFDS